jgi:hypothetical protein
MEPKGTLLHMKQPTRSPDTKFNTSNDTSLQDAQSQQFHCNSCSCRNSSAALSLQLWPLTHVTRARWMSWTLVQHCRYSMMSKWWQLLMCHLQCTDDTASDPASSMMWDECSALVTTRGAADWVWQQSRHWWLPRPVNKGDTVNDHSHNGAL